MKVVYNNPVLELTTEEENILNRASDILDSICNKTDDYVHCEHKCPIYQYCPYHKDFTHKECGKIHDLLENIVNEAEREEK